MAKRRTKQVSKTRAKRKLAKRKNNRAQKTKKKSNTTRRAKQIRYEKREALLAGLTHREYIQRRAKRERQHREKIESLFANGGNGAVFRYLIEKGNLDTYDPSILEAAGMTRKEAEDHSSRHMQRSLTEVERRAAAGDKQSQAVLNRTRS